MVNDPLIISTAGRDKWVNVDKLTLEELALINYEPSEILTIKGTMFMVHTIQLTPPFLVLVPLAKQENAEAL